MPANSFNNFADSPSAPATHAFAIVPHASDELETVTKAIYVGSAGHITVRPFASPGDVQFVNVSAGTILDIRIVAVRATGTTASGIVGLA